MTLQPQQGGLGRGGRNNRDELSFISDVQRVESEHLACPADFLAYGNRAFIKLHPHLGTRGNLIERARKAAPGWVPQAMDLWSRFEQARNQGMQSRRIGGYLRFELQAL